MNEKKFYEIILFLEKKGYKKHLDMLPVLPSIKTSADILIQKILWERRYEIIFSHDFAIYLWGEEKWENFATINKLWEYKLQRMVMKKDPFKYLLKEYNKIFERIK